MACNGNLSQNLNTPLTPVEPDNVITTNSNMKYYFSDSSKLYCTNLNEKIIDARQIDSIKKTKRQIFNEITPLKIDYPRGLLDSSPPSVSTNRDKTKIILPSGSTNVAKLNKTTYKECSVFEGCFIIPSQVWAVIFKNGKLDGNSDNMMEACLLCSRNTINTDTSQCFTCKRKFCKVCLNACTKHFFLIKNICKF